MNEDSWKGYNIGTVIGFATLSLYASFKGDVFFGLFVAIVCLLSLWGIKK